MSVWVYIPTIASQQWNVVESIIDTSIVRVKNKQRFLLETFCVQNLHQSAYTSIHMLDHCGVDGIAGIIGIPFLFHVFVNQIVVSIQLHVYVIVGNKKEKWFITMCLDKLHAHSCQCVTQTLSLLCFISRSEFRFVESATCINMCFIVTTSVG